LESDSEADADRESEIVEAIDSRSGEMFVCGMVIHPEARARSA
jgi:gamma-glutamyl-gamma-aminobutyrate hydrolase PuuD